MSPCALSQNCMFSVLNQYETNKLCSKLLLLELSRLDRVSVSPTWADRDNWAQFHLDLHDRDELRTKTALERTDFKGRGKLFQSEGLNILLKAKDFKGRRKLLNSRTWNIILKAKISMIGGNYWKLIILWRLPQINLPNTDTFLISVVDIFPWWFEIGIFPQSWNIGTSY